MVRGLLGFGFTSPQSDVFIFVLNAFLHLSVTDWNRTVDQHRTEVFLKVGLFCN